MQIVQGSGIRATMVPEHENHRQEPWKLWDGKQRPICSSIRIDKSMATMKYQKACVHVPVHHGHSHSENYMVVEMCARSSRFHM